MNKIKYLIFLLLIFIFGFNNVYASGNYRISLSATSVSKGKSVSLYIKGTNLVGGFTVSSSNSSVATVSSSSAWVEDSTVVINISAINPGSTTITVKPTTISDDDGNDLKLGAKTLNLVVTSNNGSTSDSGTSDNQKKSNDANLKSLSIEGISISPEFKGDVLEYKAEAEAGTNKIKINAVANDSKANVSGIGEVSVSDGANKLEVIVAAEDGTTKTYIVNLVVKEFDPIEIKIGNKKYTVIRKKDDLPEVDLFEDKKIKIGKDEVDGYYNDKLKIYLVGLKDERGNIGVYIYEPEDNSYTEYKWITVGGVTLYLTKPNTILYKYHKYEITIKNTKLDIYKIKRNDKVGLVYGVNVSTGNKGFYVYDKEEETLARYYDGEVNIYKKLLKDYKNYLVLFAGVCSAVVIIIILVSIIRGKKNRRRFRR